MTIEEMKARIEELEAEKNTLKVLLRAKTAELVPFQSVLNRPWVGEVFDGDYLYSDNVRNSISTLLRTVLFGKATGTKKHIGWIDPKTGKEYKWHTGRKENYKDVEARLVRGEVITHDRATVTIKQMNPEQWEKYQKAFEAVMCALDEYVSPDWKEA